MNRKILLLPLTFFMVACGDNTTPNGEQQTNSTINGGMSNQEIATALKDAAQEISAKITSENQASSKLAIKRSIEHKHEVDFEQANEVLVAPAMIYMAGRLYEQSFYRPCEEAITWTNRITQTIGENSNNVDMTLTFHAEANPAEGKMYVVAYQTVSVEGTLIGEKIPCAFDIGYDFENKTLTDYCVYGGTVDSSGNKYMSFASYEGGKYYHDDNDEASFTETQTEGSKLVTKLDSIITIGNHVATSSEENTLVDIYIETQANFNEASGITGVVTTKR